MLASAFSKARELRERITPVTHVSSFKKSGEITPEEFIVAGDYLVYKFPTWSWSSAPPSKRQDFLPTDKQYLVTKHVPSHTRTSELNKIATDIGKDEDLDEDWVVQNPQRPTEREGSETRGKEEPEEIPDIDSLEEEDLEEGDEGVIQGTTPTRTYNLYISYSKAYRVPKIYLNGFNANGNPLSPDEMFEDIMGDYKDKTVTIENAPFEENLTLISIHPCRHANVMRILLDRAEARLRSKREAEEEEKDDEEEDIVSGIAKVGLADASDDADDWQEIDSSEMKEDDLSVKVDQYLVIFLKFIASVTPGIEHDNTMAF